VLEQAIAAGASWEPKAVEVPAVVVTAENVDAFIAEHPESIGQ
jgi:ribose transport system substrate-binding protein